MPSVQDLMGDQRSPLANIFKQIEIMKKFDRSLKLVLPEELKNQCTAVNMRGGTLVISVKQQSLVSRFHYLKTDLLEKFKAHEQLRYVKDIKTVVG